MTLSAGGALTLPAGSVTNAMLATSYATTASLSSYATTSSLSSYATTSSLSSYATTASLSSYALLASPTFTGTTTFPGSTTINSSGYVGIGTTNPQATLHVNGGLKFNSITMDGVYYCKIGTGVGTGYSSTISTLTNVNIPTAIRTSSFASFDGTTITFNNTGYYSVNLQLNLVSLNGTSTYINLSSTTGANVTAYSACSGGVNNLAVTGQSSVIYTTWLIKVNNASSGNTCYFTMIPQGGGPGVREIWYQTGQYGFISIVYTDTL